MRSSFAEPVGTGPARDLRARFRPVLVIISPPRCGSTVLARSLWRHPRFGWYVHEPYDEAYHRGGDLQSVREAMAGAVPQPAAERDGGPGPGVIVKEMTFQAGPLLPELLHAATMPVVVTVRDPRLAVRSRMRQRAAGGAEPCFPPAETGWPALRDALAYLRRHGLPYVLVDVTELRRDPAALLPELCARLGLGFTPDMLAWPRADHIALGRLEDEQRHWYTRVLGSTGFEPPAERMPDLSEFPVRDGMRAHVEGCVALYHELLTDPCLLHAHDDRLGGGHALQRNALQRNDPRRDTR